MPWLSVSVSDRIKGNIGRAIESGQSAVLPFPCSNTTDCTYYSVSLSAGKYILEVWGSQGGNATHCPTKSFGGRGGYSKGTLTLNKPQKLYVYVGGAGTGDKRSSRGSSGGGGSTDIRLSPGDWDSSEGLNSRIIVAGGGGGNDGFNCKFPYIGNDGGGMNAPTFTTKGDNGEVVTVSGGTKNSGGSSNYFATSGNAPGSFGFARANPKSNVYSVGGYNGGSRGSDVWPNGGAGGGWWGGCTSYPAGSGGSGFVFNELSSHPNNAISANFLLSEGESISGNTEFKDPFGNLETGHHGNGAAKITYVFLTKNQIHSKPHSNSLFHFSIFVSFLAS